MTKNNVKYTNRIESPQIHLGVTGMQFTTSVELQNSGEKIIFLMNRVKTLVIHPEINEN